MIRGHMWPKAFLGIKKTPTKSVKILITPIINILRIIVHDEHLTYDFILVIFIEISRFHRFNS